MSLPKNQTKKQLQKALEGMLERKASRVRVNLELTGAACEAWAELVQQGARIKLAQEEVMTLLLSKAFQPVSLALNQATTEGHHYSGDQS